MFVVKIKWLIPTIHIEATIGIIEFIEAPNKTIVNQKHCKKITLRINIIFSKMRTIF